MTDTHSCPRRVENPRMPGDDGNDEWNVRNYPDSPEIINNGRRACSYCGSMHPEDFLVALRDGAELGPTDKNYKAYVKWDGASAQGKFYYQHLSEDQRREFIEMLNAKRVRIGYPGHLYVLPFFTSRTPA